MKFSSKSTPQGDINSSTKPKVKLRINKTLHYQNLANI